MASCRVRCQYGIPRTRRSSGAVTLMLSSRPSTSHRTAGDEPLRRCHGATFIGDAIRRFPEWACCKARCRLQVAAKQLWRERAPECTVASSSVPWRCADHRHLPRLTVSFMRTGAASKPPTGCGAGLLQSADSDAVTSVAAGDSGVPHHAPAAQLSLCSDIGQGRECSAARTLNRLRSHAAGTQVRSGLPLQLTFLCPGQRSSSGARASMKPSTVGMLCQQRIENACSIIGLPSSGQVLLGEYRNAESASLTAGRRNDGPDHGWRGRPWALRVRRSFFSGSIDPIERFTGLDHAHLVPGPFFDRRPRRI